LTIVPIEGGRFQQVGDTSGLFWIKSDQGEARKNQELEIFTKKIGRIRGDFPGEVAVILHPGMFDLSRTEMRLRNKSVRIDIDGVIYSVDLEVMSKTLPVSLRCNQVVPKLKRVANAGVVNISMPVAAPMFEIIIRIVPATDKVSVVESESSITVLPVQGNIRVPEVSAAEDAVPAGGLTHLSMRAATGRMKFGDDDIELTNLDSLDLWGDFRAAIVRDQTIVVGNAHAAWKGDQRLNKTKWERLPADWQIWIIGGVLAATIAGLGLARKTIGGSLQDDILSW
jgi:hypothetical protein